MNFSLRKAVCLLASSSLLFSSTVFSAAEEATKKAPTLTDSDMTSNLIQTTLGLLLVLLLIGATAWAVKRFGNVKMGAQGRMKVIGGISLGTRERVVLLEVGEQQLVLGIAPGHISTLHVLEHPIPPETKIRQSGGFAERLQSVLKGENPNRKSVS